MIAHPDDLGTVSALWDKPQTYANYLGYELSLAYTGRLLVVMPSGSASTGTRPGWSGEASTSLSRSSQFPAAHPTLVAATQSAVYRVEAAAGVKGAALARSGWWRNCQSTVDVCECWCFSTCRRLDQECEAQPRQRDVGGVVLGASGPHGSSSTRAGAQGRLEKLRKAIGSTRVRGGPKRSAGLRADGASTDGPLIVVGRALLINQSNNAATHRHRGDARDQSTPGSGHLARSAPRAELHAGRPNRPAR